jgi:hypothetical protein
MYIECEPCPKENGIKNEGYWEHIREHLGNIGKTNLTWHTPILKTVGDAPKEGQEHELSYT